MTRPHGPACHVVGQDRRVRKLYHFWPVGDGGGFDAWDVDRMIALDRNRSVEAVLFDSIVEIETPCWADGRWSNDGTVSDAAVRQALTADAATVASVIERAIPCFIIIRGGHPPADALEAWASGRTVEAVREMIEVTDGFVATVDQAVVGWASLDDEVDQLFVAPDAGGQGVARRLYRTIEALALAIGLDYLRAVSS